MKNTLLHHYKNGNVDVKIYENGTKVREWPDGEKPVSEYPESADVKITGWCDMSHICKYCHEQSNLEGQHGDLDALARVWETQKPGTEMAIGGGNPLAHPDLYHFLVKMKGLSIIPNVTVNIMHMKKFAPTIKMYQADKLIYGLGISYRGPQSLGLLPADIDYKNVVFHMILGIHTLDDCRAVIDWCVRRDIMPKILLLGYKTYGNGITCYTEELKQTLEVWKELYLKALLNSEANVVISFDNLAIEQLDLKSQVKPEIWDELFQGNDGNHTMYFDAVKQVVARTSTTAERFTFNQESDIRDLFNKVKVAA